jgi:zinc protease
MVHFEAGFSGLNDINKFMTGKIARVNPYIGGTKKVYVFFYKGFRISFQMTYAYFTDLNFDQEALKALSKSSLVLKHGIYKLFSTRVLRI